MCAHFVLAIALYMSGVQVYDEPQQIFGQRGALMHLVVVTVQGRCHDLAHSADHGLVTIRAAKLGI